MKRNQKPWLKWYDSLPRVLLLLIVLFFFLDLFLSYPVHRSPLHKWSGAVPSVPSSAESVGRRKKYGGTHGAALLPSHLRRFSQPIVSPR